MEERRKFKRYDIYCPIQYKAEDEKGRDYSVTINLSEGGALISVEKILSIGTNIIVKFILRNEEFFIRAKVVHVQHGKGRGTYNIGLEFLDKPDNFTQKFYAELETIMLYQRQYNKESAAEISLSEASLKWYRNAQIWP